MGTHCSINTRESISRSPGYRLSPLTLDETLTEAKAQCLTWFESTFVLLPSYTGKKAKKSFASLSVDFRKQTRRLLLQTDGD